MTQDTLIYALTALPVVLLSLSVHEAAHAITAKWGGDLTAHAQGRVTLNPIAHIDPIGTLLLPMLSVISGIPLIGWAKPVPTVDTNYTRGKSYGVVVAMAGPFSNLILALLSTVMAMFLVLGATLLQDLGVLLNERLFGVLLHFVMLGIVVNISLMFFNLIPLPPLDGHWPVWYWFIRGHPEREETFFAVARFGGPILLLLLWTGAIGFYMNFVNSHVTTLLLQYVNNFHARIP
ncbi:site-2 protease family protein [bacterium]|nr:site-2 protease family protein [bacterium]